MFLPFVCFQEFRAEIAERHLRLEDAEKLGRCCSPTTMNMITSVPLLDATSTNVRARSLRSGVDTHLANASWQNRQAPLSGSSPGR